MLTLDLARLDRQGKLRVEADVPPDDPLWEGTELGWATPLSVDLEASAVASGEYLVRGRVRGRLQRECRRCLDPVPVDVDEEVTLLFAPQDALEPEERDDEAYPVPLDGSELDLGGAIREELILRAPAYVVCRPDCRGLCPVCGTDLNDETCDCTRQEPDPRWDALRALKSE